MTSSTLAQRYPPRASTGVACDETSRVHDVPQRRRAGKIHLPTMKHAIFHGQVAAGTVDISGGVHVGAGGGVPMASVLLPPPAQQAPMNPLVHMRAGMPVTMQHMVSAAGQVCALSTAAVCAEF